MEVGQPIKDRGWRQGSFLPPAEVSTLAQNAGLKDVTHAIILSQDCDVVCRILETEPHVEILFLQSLPRLDKNARDGKSYRKLEIEATHGSSSLFLRAVPWHRLQINRHRLIEIEPDTTISLDSKTLRTLIEWFAERYTRTSFPDSFVERVRTKDNDLKKLLTKHASLFWKILIQVDPHGELDQHHPYDVDIKCVVHSDVWKDSILREQAKDAASELCKLLKQCSDIEIVTCTADSEDELPLSTLKTFRLWDIFNYLTHRERLDSEGD